MLLLLAVAATVQVSPENASSTSDGDLALFRRIVAEMQGGASYYAAAHHQLVTSGYGTQSVFNWRLPGLAFLLSVLPSLDIGQWMLIVIAVFAGNVMVWVVNQQGGSRLAALGAVVMLLSLAGAFTPGTVLLSELAAGIFVLLSVALYGSGLRRAGLAAGAAALFAREFAGIYILVCIWLAWRAKRWHELSAWAAVLLVYGAYFLWHYGQVQLHVTPADRGYAEDWVQFGGLSFVLATSAFNGFFALLPTPAHAVLLPVALLGLLAWPGETGARASLTVLAVIIVFAVVGKPFNTYWGLIYTPLLSLGLAWAPWAIADLMRGALGRRRTEPQIG
ncbi:hypothetical protein DevBK_19735 [Devosia sp. BK]|uniref:hypothetical protein n=1 Tax=Devosia sp. BK TaxID=2871706 RepID=UPI00293AAB3D|nr:hypothetical protein [Devosia sp. BK]MDV3253577.1 hypothetical protein [Devosia sp. BK]